MEQAPDQRTRVAIACQGGGSHTAFTAGVLKGLLGADALSRHQIVGLSGTSGGAVCALLAWYALLDDDPAAAGRLLDAFRADNPATTPTEQLVNAWLLWASRLEHARRGTARRARPLPQRHRPRDRADPVAVVACARYDVKAQPGSGLHRRARRPRPRPGRGVRGRARLRGRVAAARRRRRPRPPGRGRGAGGRRALR